MEIPDALLEDFANTFDECVAVDVAGRLTYGEVLALYRLLEFISPGAGEPWKEHHRASEIESREPDPWAKNE